MFRLWSLTEQDLLSESVPYRLRDTGQGLNRVQAAPKTLRLMHTILHRAQQSVGSWVGSSAIHMGDHNVPNALMFIGKPSSSPSPPNVSDPFPCRQVFSNLPHPPSRLQHPLTNTVSLRQTRAACLHRRRVRFDRKLYPRGPVRFLPARFRRFRGGQLFRCGELYRRAIDERVELVCAVGEEAVFSRVLVDRYVPFF